jgi:hypothetical protein
MKKKRPIGRPRGKEPSMVVNVRMPASLLDRLDSYLERRERESPEALNRGMVIRELLEDMLEGEGL